MKRSLRAKILIRICIVAVVSFVLSAAFTYYYYKTILEKQSIRDDEAKLRQTARQLQYMSDDIANFTSFLIISEKLQSFYKNYDQLDTYGQFAIAQEAIDYVKNYKGLKKEVDSFALVLPSGKVIWSEAQQDDYFYDHMREPWYQHYAASGQTFAFTETHFMFRAGPASIKSKTISYIAKVRDIDNSNRVIGELILNLDYSVFESLLQFSSANYDGYLWLNEANHTLYQKNGLLDGMFDFASLPNDENELVLKNYRGYALIDRFAGHNWKLVSFTSLLTLLQRSKFPIYLLIVFTLTSTILILLLMMPVIFNITRPVYHLFKAMNSVSAGNLQTTVDIRTGDELERLGQGFNRMVGQLRVHLKESIRHEQEKRDMEMDLLLSQINPHFIYNTLNTIIFMAQKQNNLDIARITGAFITLLQDTVKIGETHTLIALRDETNIIREYTVIQSYRYQDMFDLQWSVEDEALDCLIPRNIIQPLVENAIFHGIRPKKAKGCIRIGASVRNGQLTVQVRDDGVGIQPEKLEQIVKGQFNVQKKHGIRHIGLINTMKRLDVLFKGKASLLIESEPDQGTNVQILLPEIRKAQESSWKQTVG
jgi:two-component system sensor histidine kinase YesM